MARRALLAGRLRYALLAAALVVAGAGVAAELLADDPAEASRYPFDPACAWGRVADGRGMLLRCLTEAEARALVPASAFLPPPAPPPPSASASASAPAPSASTPPPPETSPAVADIARVDADVGTLPEAVESLRKGRDKLTACVNDHGGLEGAEGSVAVRFLVRGRGRAEGVSVQSRVGVSADAARCVADVVDRRYVGYPDEPIVGGTVHVVVKRKP